MHLNHGSIVETYLGSKLLECLKREQDLQHNHQINITSRKISLRSDKELFFIPLGGLVLKSCLENADTNSWENPTIHLAGIFNPEMDGEPPEKSPSIQSSSSDSRNLSLRRIAKSGEHLQFDYSMEPVRIHFLHCSFNNHSEMKSSHGAGGSGIFSDFKTTDSCYDYVSSSVKCDSNHEDSDMCNDTKIGDVIQFDVGVGFNGLLTRIVEILDLDRLTSLFKTNRTDKCEYNQFCDSYINRYLNIDRIRKFNNDPERVEASGRIRTAMQFVGGGKCVVQGNDFACTGYYACFDYVDRSCIAFHKFDRTNETLVADAREQLLLLSELGIDGSGMDSEDFGVLNGQAWLVDLGKNSLVDRTMKSSEIDKVE
ncbi:unnamed protein product [Ambrosiozyma monospora]|uniref:Unnamed protein product n=1 Tax=Ambrosiozyma monospora TaxID=43982 RepID=A0ACB5SZA4_AMBMO|nr:unnamed protein product [Ambrosiozyma monospora]